MPRPLLLTLMLSAVTFGTDSAFAKGGRGRDQESARYGWGPSLAEGKRQASKTGKPMMVVIRCVP